MYSPNDTQYFRYLLQIILLFSLEKDLGDLEEFHKLDPIHQLPLAVKDRHQISLKSNSIGWKSKLSGSPSRQFDEKFWWKINDANQLDQRYKMLFSHFQVSIANNITI